MVTFSGDNSIDHVIYPLVIGPALLAWGLAMLQGKRQIENTPISKVRSAAMGMVALAGMSQPRRKMDDPISGAPCCWWRCVVQELRSSGKNSRWEDVQELTCPELLYLQDSTGQMLVDPRDAELYVPEQVIPVNSVNRAKLQPVMAAWGVTTTGWFGGNKELRIKEQVIYPQFPLYVLGELTHRHDHLEGRKQRFLEKVQAAKKNSQKMAEADANRDGTIDSQEWDAFRLKLEREFLDEEAAREASIPEGDKLVVRKPQDHAFIVSTQSEKELAGSMGWKSLAGVIGGIALSGLGTWLALLNDYSYPTTASLAAGGVVIGLFLGRFRGSAKRSIRGGLSWYLSRSS